MDNILFVHITKSNYQITHNSLNLQFSEGLIIAARNKNIFIFIPVHNLALSTIIYNKTHTVAVFIVNNFMQAHNTITIEQFHDVNFTLNIF
jgi:hypothetical protein